jgi:putative hemolysin
MNKKPLIVIILIISAVALFYFLSGGKFETSDIPGLSILDSASNNCTDKGGAIQEKQRGDGSKYKICLFEDNRQCEADSLLNGDCPIGGLKVTGYITEAAVYCAILGGNYEVTGMNNNAENGNCSFFNGNICNVWDLYNGKCQKGAIDAINYENQEFNFSLKLPSSWKDQYQVETKTGENEIRYISFDYEDANLFKISVVPYSFWANKTKKEGEYLGRNNTDVFAFIYSSDPLRSDKQWGEEYLEMISRAEDIKGTFKITKPYIFLEKETESGKNYTIETMYPFVGAVENGQVNIEISNFIENIKNSFKEAASGADAWQGENTLEIYYDPYEINSNFVSIRFEISEYTGGAHSMTYSKSFNYDLKKNKAIELSDIFDSNKDYLNNISAKSIQYLLKLNNENNFSDEESIKEGAGPKQENFEIFTFNKNTVVFYFNPYQVAPYVAGRQDVIFPFSSIKDILRSDALLNYGLND